MLRRWSALALFMILILSLIPSQAFDQLTWEQKCAYKLSRNVTTYTVSKAEDGSPILTESGSIAAGTYVSAGEYDPATELQQVHTSQSGTAWIKDRGAIVSATKQVRFDDGSSLSLSEALVNDRGALMRILQQMYPTRKITAVPGSDTFHMEYIEKPPENTPIPQGGGEDTAPPATSDDTPPAQEGGKGASAEGGQAGESAPRQIIPLRPEPQGLEVKHLGFVMSTALIDGQWRQVPTRELKLSGGAPDVAAIYAPKIGKVRLRMKPKNDGAIINYCRAGSIVQVLERGKRFSQVIYENMVGYVLNDCLIAPEDLSKARAGELTYKGNPRVHTTVNLRHDASAKSLRIAELPTGTPLQIFDIKDGWAMVEGGGVFGYVLEEFVQLTEEESPLAEKLPATDRAWPLFRFDHGSG